MATRRAERAEAPAHFAGHISLGTFAGHNRRAQSLGTIAGHISPKLAGQTRSKGAMSVRPVGIPVRVAVSAWAAGALAVGGSLLFLAADVGVHAEVPAAAPLEIVPLPPGRLPDGREEAGTLHVTPQRVRASLPVPHAPAVYGWGTVRLDAEPLQDELTVRTIVDAPTHARRWTTRCEVLLRIDGNEVRAQAQPVGTRLKSGVFYDAVRFELGIDTVRRLSRAEHIEGTLCGDPLTLLPTQRETLGRFVQGFDDLALPALPSRETPCERMPTDPDEPIDDPDTFLEPA